MYPKEFIDYLVHFHGDRDYFECHEILEDYWKQVDPKNKQSIWVGFIQLAVANYHHRRSNYNGAKRTLDKAISIFKNQQNAISQLGIEYKKLIQVLNGRFLELEKRLPYRSMVIPIYDSFLLENCKHQCKQKGWIWGKESDLQNELLIHRHKLRDRTSVMAEREQAIKLRKGND